MKRRLFSTAAVSALALPALPVRTQTAPDPGPGEILLGQTADLSASRSAITRAYSDGARLHFEQVNRLGGIHGRRIRVVQVDDAYQADRAMTNAAMLIDRQQVFALIHAVGTGIAEKLVPFVEQQGVPLVHPVTGADQVRAPALVTRQTFFLRASYGREIQKIATQLKTVGINNIALVHEDEPFGLGIRAQTLTIMSHHGLKLSAIGVLPFNRPDEVAKAVAEVTQAQPTAVIMGSAGPAVEKFIAAGHEGGLRTQYHCLSVSNVDRLYKALGRLSEGIVVCQVMPAVRTSNLPVVRDYRRATAAMDAAPSSFGLEGYISARVIVEALRGAGPQLTRSRFLGAMESPAASQVGGFPVSYQGQARNGSPFVELGMVSSNGHLRL